MAADRRAGALRSDKIEAAIARAAEGGSAGPLLDLLEQRSGLGGPHVNLDLARAAGAAIAARGARADRLIAALTASGGELPRVVAAQALAARAARPSDAARPGSASRPDPALAALQELAEDPRRLVRDGVVDALRGLLAARGDDAVRALATWTDGYLQAHVALSALADRTLLAGLSSAGEVVARLSEAFTLADASPRSAERLQGVRQLRQGLPAQIAALSARFPEVLAWLEGETSAGRPETREVVAQAIAALRRSSLSDAEAARLAAALDASAPPPRDPTRVVHGTRRRSKGRR